MKKVLSLAALLLLLGLASLGSPTAVRSVQPARDEVLSWLPSEMIGFLHLKGDGLWNHPVAKEVLSKLPPSQARDVNRASEHLKKALGVALTDLQSATVYLRTVDMARQSISFAAVLRSARPFDRDAIAATLKAAAGGEAETLKHGDVELTLVPGPGGRDRHYAGLAEGDTVVYGELQAVKKLLDQRRQPQPGGNLSGAVAEAARHDVSLAFHLPEDLTKRVREMIEELGTLGASSARTFQRADEAIGNARVNPPLPVPDAPQPDSRLSVIRLLTDVLLDVQQFQMYLDTRTDLRIKLAIECRSDTNARRFFRGLHAMTLSAEMGLESMQLWQAREPAKGVPPEIAAMIKRGSTALSESQTTIEGKKVQFALELPGFSADLGKLMSGTVGKVIAARDKMLRHSNLRQIAIAFHNYHADYAKLPAVASYTKTQPRKPLLSWRVHLLPYLEADNIYKQFKMDEPWDSEHNKKLIPLMPPIYRVVGAPDPGEGKTYFQVFVAPEKTPEGKKDEFQPIFRLGAAGRTLGQITVMDGTSNTILVAEAAEAVIWTKPDDLLIEHDRAPLPKLGAVPEEDGFAAAFGDGSVREIRRSLPSRETYEALLRQLIGVKDGRNEDVAPIMK